MPASGDTLTCREYLHTCPSLLSLLFMSSAGMTEPVKGQQSLGDALCGCMQADLHYASISGGVVSSPALTV